MTIVEFLTARYDEEQALAEAVAKEEGASWYPGDDSVHSTDGGQVACGPWDYMAPETRQHIASHDPARTLADIAAKRAILSWCTERDQIWVGSMGADPTDPKNYAPGDLSHRTDAPILRLLAASYRQHDWSNS